MSLMHTISVPTDFARRRGAKAIGDQIAQTMVPASIAEQAFRKKVPPVPKAFLIGKTLAKHANSAQNGVSFKLPLATIAILLREIPYWGIHKWSETARMGGQRRLQ
ncbi:MAG: hypothetical protein Rhob2KO_20950 [Rhodopirellula baltica]